MKKKYLINFNKDTGVTNKGLRSIAGKYITFQNKVFGIGVDGYRIYIGNESNEDIINDDLINNK